MDNPRPQSTLPNILRHRWFLPLADMALAFAAFGLAYYVRYELQILRPVSEFNFSPFSPYLPYAAVYLPWLWLTYQGGGLYRAARGRSWVEEAYIIGNGAMTATVVLMALSFVFQPLVFSRLMLIYVALITIVLLTALRAARAGLQAYLRSKGIGIKRVLVIGAGEVGKAVLRTMIARPALGYRPIGYLDDDPERGYVDLGRMKGLGRLQNIEQVIADEAVDLVMITLPWAYHRDILDLLQRCTQAGVEVRIVPDAFQLNLRQVQIENLDGIPLLNVSGGAALRGTNRLFKRSVDIGLIVLLSPILLVLGALVALLIRLDGTGPVFYTQERIGENGRAFKMMKFRSMVPGAESMRAQLVEAHGNDPRLPKIKDDPRVTRVGRFIRTASLDELPNLINVLRGQMSLVGPRPPTPEEVELYETWHLQRLQSLPGITGLWQVSGRSDVPFEEMCLLDIYYIENWSIRLDMQILLMTIPRVLIGSGAY